MSLPQTASIHVLGGFCMWTLIALICCAALISEVIWLGRVYAFSHNSFARIVVSLGMLTRLLVTACAALLVLSYLT